jgi:hypothetical protein
MRPKDLDFETWNELYDYILESKINGQKKQALEIFKAMTQDKRIKFIDYISDMYYFDSMHYDEQKELAQTIEFFEKELNFKL